MQDKEVGFWISEHELYKLENCKTPFNYSGRSEEQDYTLYYEIEGTEDNISTIHGVLND